MAGRINSKIKSKRFMKPAAEKVCVKQSDEEDVSLLRKPLKTNLTNLTKLIKLYQNTTEEIRKYLAYENDILHECRVCRSIFRSVTNFILHKQSYCLEQYSYANQRLQQGGEDECVSIIEKNLDSEKKAADGIGKKNLNSVLERIAQKKLSEIESQSAFVDEADSAASSGKPGINVILNHIDMSAAAFQTVTNEEKFDEMKDEVMELHTMLNGGTAVLGPDGKIFDVNQKTMNYLKSFSDENIDITEMNDITCDDCNIKFATRKTYLSHMKYKHNESRMIFPCPDCADTFANPWSVYRHLINVHRKTIPQVRKLRSQVQSKAYRKDQIPVKRVTELAKLSKSTDEREKVEDENQAWIDNFEGDNDIQMCGGCGRRFERRAALNSHSQMCQKRIALRNTIISNKLKRSAVADDKTDKKLLKLGIDAEFKNNDKRKPLVTKRKKAGIQIRCDYTKPDKSREAKENEAGEDKSKTPDKEENFHTELSQETQDGDVTTNSPVYPAEVMSNTEALYTIIGISRNSNDGSHSKSTSPMQDEDLHSEEVIFIPNSDISPRKDEEDPLSIKDINNESDSEIEEIMNSMANSSNSSHEPNSPKESFIVPPQRNKAEKIISENALKIIQLLNPTENKDSIDYRMSNYVDLKSFQCNNCGVKFPNISKLRCHMALHFNWLRYRCDMCSFKAFDKILMQNHVIEAHSLHEWEKIEAVIFQIPEWETLAMAWGHFQQIDAVYTPLELAAENMSIVLISDKEDDDRKGNVTPDACIVVQNINVNKSKGRGRPKKLKRAPVKKKTGKTLENEQKENEKSDEILMMDVDEQSDLKCPSRSDSCRSDCSNIQDPVVRKMVYEVIFGENSNTTADMSKVNKEPESKEGSPDSAEVSNVLTRPVRTRKHHLDKDFVYDLHEFKDLSKAVLSTSNSRLALESADVDNIKFESKKVIKQYTRRPGPRCKTYVGGSDAEPARKPKADVPDAVYYVDPAAAPLACDNTLHSDSDSDIYIIESDDTHIIGT